MDKIYTCSLFLVFILGGFMSLSVEAQVSFGGIPPSFQNTKSFTLAAPAVKSFTPSEDIESLKKQDMYAKQNGMPPIVATLLSTHLDLASEGTWSSISDDSICRLSIQSAGAPGIFLYYEKFRIPPGGKLYIYNADKTQLLGAYTSSTNARGGCFSTEVIYGDALTLEYVKPKGSENPEVVVSDIGYGYNLSELTTTSEGSSLKSTSSSNCYVGINCSPEGDDWQEQKKGVAKIIVRIGSKSYLCTGSLVNNVYQDHTPYFLSAHHCFNQDSQTADYSSIQFYFHYEATECGGSTISSAAKTMVGADMLVDSPLKGGSDGTLLRLTDTIPSSYDVYYNGWDITSTAPSKGAVIHHPGGDLQKISIYNTTPTTITFVDSGDTCAVGAHWDVVYAETTNGFSVTAGGSSGSPMFNQDGRIVGTLTGGESYCSTPTEPDYYGKFSYHWNKAASSSQWMSNYLNAPGYDGITKIDGIGSTTIRDTLTGAENIQITPRIVGDYLYITSSYEIKSIQAYAISGRLVASTTSSPVNAEGWASGVYILSVTTSEGRARAKVVKR